MAFGGFAVAAAAGANSRRPEGYDFHKPSYWTSLPPRFGWNMKQNSDFACTHYGSYYIEAYYMGFNAKYKDYELMALVEENGKTWYYFWKCDSDKTKWENACELIVEIRGMIERHELKILMGEGVPGMNDIKQYVCPMQPWPSHYMIERIRRHRDDK